MEQILIIVSMSALGAIIGSLFGVLTERIPRGEDYVCKPSYCTSCGKKLKPYQNIPIVSWIMLFGRCAYCGAKIPLKLFLYEVVFAMLFGLSACLVIAS